jgi:ubiquinol-cytochrome c reductase cytochrome b/c1 subunit
MIIGVSVLHVWTLHVVGQNNPDGIDLQEGRDTVPFTPHATVKDIFGTTCFLILYAWFVLYISRRQLYPGQSVGDAGGNRA